MTLLRVILIRFAAMLRSMPRVFSKQMRTFRPCFVWRNVVTYDERWRLCFALKDYATEECQPYLKQWFKNDESKSTRVTAAWGLGKLGDKEAIAYLIRMLDDLIEKDQLSLNRASPLDLRRRFATSINGRLNGKNRTSPKLLRGSKKLA